MGEMIKSFCKNCNYKQDNLSIGYGFDFTRGSMMPAFCESCDKLQLADMGKENVTCKIHKTPIQFYHADESLSKEVNSDKNQAVVEWEGAYILKAKYKCPNCKQYSLKFTNKGINWD